MPCSANIVGRSPARNGQRSAGPLSRKQRSLGIVNRGRNGGCVRPGRVERPGGALHRDLATWLGWLALAVLATGLAVLAAA